MEQPEKATPLSEEEHNSIAAAIARIPSGCSILTAGNESRATGTLRSLHCRPPVTPPKARRSTSRWNHVATKAALLLVQTP